MSVSVPGQFADDLFDSANAKFDSNSNFAEIRRAQLDRESNKLSSLLARRPRMTERLRKSAINSHCYLRLLLIAVLPLVVVAPAPVGGQYASIPGVWS